MKVKYTNPYPNLQLLAFNIIKANAGEFVEYKMGPETVKNFK